MPTAGNADAVWNDIECAWEEVEVELYQNFVRSMTSRLRTVMENVGEWTGYQQYYT